MLPWNSDKRRSRSTFIVITTFALALGVCVGASTRAANAAAGPSEKALRAAAKALYESGREHHLAGKYAEALAEYRKAYELYPSPSLKFNMAQAARLLGESGLALQYYREYLEESPDATNREMVLGWIEALEDLALDEPAPTEPPKKDPEPPPVVEKPVPDVMPTAVDVADAPMEPVAPPPKRKGLPRWAVPVIILGTAAAVAGATAGVLVGVISAGPRFETTELGAFEI